MEWYAASVLGTSTSLSLYWITKAITKRTSNWFWLGPILGICVGVASLFSLDPAPLSVLYIGLLAWGVASLTNLIVAYSTGGEVKAKAPIHPELKKIPKTEPPPGVKQKIRNAVTRAKNTVKATLALPSLTKEGTHEVDNAETDLRAREEELVKAVHSQTSFKERVDALINTLEQASEYRIRSTDFQTGKADNEVLLRIQSLLHAELVKERGLSLENNLEDAVVQLNFIDNVVIAVDDHFKQENSDILTYLPIATLPIGLLSYSLFVLVNAAYYLNWKRVSVNEEVNMHLTVNTFVRNILEKNLLVKDGREPQTSFVHSLREAEDQTKAEGIEFVRQGSQS